MLKFVLPFAALALSACVVTQDQATMSRFTTPTSGGFVIENFNNMSSLRERDIQGDGFAYASGSITNEGLIAVSGVIPGSTGGAVVSSGSATYAGRYELLRMSNIDLSGGFISASQTQRTGTINLLANFSNGTLTGQSGGLSINGVVSGTGISGGVTFEGVAGDLTGVIGDDKAIGAFHGNSANLIYAGGFLTYD